MRPPLLSVAMMCEAGHIDHLCKDNPFIKHVRTGEVTALRRERNMLILGMWIRSPPKGQQATPFFRRQGTA